MSKSIFSKDHKILVKKLKEARLDARMDQINAAKALGKSQSYISKAESGQRRIDIIQLKEFAKVYKKNIKFFVK